MNTVTTVSPTLLESDRLLRIKQAGRYKPRSPADRAGLCVLVAVGWARDVGNDEWELTEEGKRRC